MNETQEYLDIMAGKKRLQLEYKEGNLVSGYTAHGLSARIIESLHGGQYIEGWGFLVDREFEDGDIERMKRHFFEWKEMEEVQEQLEQEEQRLAEEEKERLLKDAVWTYKESFQMDGSRAYLHGVKIGNQQFLFQEKKIQGLGRVVVPQYEVCKDSFGEPLPEWIDGRWCWTYVMGGREETLPMTPEEERAYRIVYQYGPLQAV